MSDPATRWHASCDGTATPNPGRIGVGVLLVAPDGTCHEISRPLGRHGCNNEAELLAISQTLTLAAEAGARHLTVCSDSRMAIDHLLGRERTHIPRLVALLEQLQAQMHGFEVVDLQWMPRHRNARADKLARTALGLPEKPVKTRQRKRR